MIGYAVYRVDVSQMLDKYIGEGEKKISALFKEARRSRVALFFDEADTIFGKRTEIKDSHDKYANSSVGHLLVELESYDGLSILATNLASNIDAAFMRRIRVRADFPAPDAADRKKIWERLLPPADERDADVDIGQLSGPFELVGGEIRNAIYTAHLLAAQEGAERLAMRHLTRALARELNKSGRLSGVGDFDLARPPPGRLRRAL
jgi:SpoVK/Ycf46/Vps4 family AAA+-type ATPase